MKLIHIPRAVYFFFLGLERNFKIIRYGDVPEIYVRPIDLERYSFASGRAFSYLAVLRELAMHLFKPSQKFYQLPGADVLFCGGSANNEREFHFLSSLLAGTVPGLEYSRDKNLAFVNSAGLRKRVGEQVVAVLLFLVCLVYLFRIKINPTSFKYLLSFSKIYLQVLCSVNRSGHLPKLTVVANDHTDFPVAADMVMKSFRVPVIYVQHAEISEGFPPLDFDVSVLRNNKTLEKYQAIGQVKGEVFIIPRTGCASNVSRILDVAVMGSINIVLYLSSVYDQAAVQDCIDMLSKNPGVKKVSIKRHPRTPAEVLKNTFDVEVLDHAPTEHHIAVVPNSSVAIELLERGVRVFQYFALDNIHPDYYGLVADGVTPAVTYHELMTDFWCTEFYSKEWLERFYKYTVAADESWRQQVPILSKRLQGLLG